MVNNVNDPGATNPITSSDGVYINAILLPLFAFPAWILCCIPMGWHFSQHNIAAGSLLLWVVLVNFFNSINPLIWPDDNLEQWWHGHGWCDISIRIQVGAGVAIASCAAMIVRKLAMVMDTSKMTVSSSRSPGVKEKLIEIVWCWGWPMVLIAMHAMVSGVRYMIFGIVGCISEYHASWPSLALGYIWTPITTLGAAYYALLLIYRLYIYRREFSRILAARNTTKSRFLRLFVICMIIILTYLPYSIWLLISVWPQYMQHDFDWNFIHGPRSETILKIPSGGDVSVDKWGQVATSYVIFLALGTGNDSHNLYKKILLSFGLGKYFPSLYIKRGDGTSSPSRFSLWSSTLSSKVKGIFTTTSVTQTSASVGSFGGSTATDSIMFKGSYLKGSVTPEVPLHSQDHPELVLTESNKRPSFFRHIFPKPSRNHSILPVFSRAAPASHTRQKPSEVGTVTSGVQAHAWASEEHGSSRMSQQDGVHICQEIHQDREPVARVDTNDTDKPLVPARVWT